MRWLLPLLGLACTATAQGDEDLLAHGEMGQLQQAWGGTAPEEWGLEDGMTDLIPTSSDRFYWYPYNGGVNDDTWDMVTLAVATLDAELPTLRWPAHQDDATYDPDEVLVSVSVKHPDEAVPPECEDTEEGTPCTLGQAQCIKRTNNIGSFDVCHHYRAVLWWNRILSNTAARHPEENPLDVLKAVTRHELTHVLGFRHGDGGPMANGDLPLTECQVAKLELYHSDFNATGWVYTTPEECN